ncbi:hypothetical protein LINPERHAP2_LOCUS24554 [Linum perenne]
MVGRSIPLMCSKVEIGNSLFPTSFEKAIESLICLHTTDTPLILVFMLTVPIPTILIELFGVTMQGPVFLDLFQ